MILHYQQQRERTKNVKKNRKMSFLSTLESYKERRTLLGGPKVEKDE